MNIKTNEGVIISDKESRIITHNLMKNRKSYADKTAVKREFYRQLAVMRFLPENTFNYLFEVSNETKND